jgi:hypothetical protein
LLYQLSYTPTPRRTLYTYGLNLSRGAGKDF